ncbi:MAG: 50S ribosomal protein L24 [Leptospiraceae bacterium]|nr:50S ribosomal protein L24 [Leptospiraceae bacterium]
MAKNQAKQHQPRKLRVDDEVIVIAGKEKGKRGTIMFIDRKSDKVIVQGVNRVTRFQRPTQDNPQGGQIDVEMPLHISNIMYYDAKLKKGVRVGYDQKDGRKVRVERGAGGNGEIKEKDKKK